MGLSQSQQALLSRARSLGTGAAAITLDDAQMRALLAVVTTDLDREGDFPEMSPVRDFFSAQPIDSLRQPGADFLNLYERALKKDPDADTYFFCLAALHKSRLKYQHILRAQPLPTVDQVGPRALLQYGTMPPRQLTAFLFWRKWLFDIDNRSGQETGYLFEPIIAYAIGGFPVAASRSPVKRRSNKSKGRQVDCIRDRDAYEFKMRVTIAASGQGRWQEELDFPEDCRESGFRPLLVVLDPTPNPKLKALVSAFRAAGGAAYVGAAAWEHLEAAAGKTMGLFLERYVRRPIQDVLTASPDPLPPMELEMRADAVVFRIEGVETVVTRSGADLSLFDEPAAEVEEADA